MTQAIWVILGVLAVPVVLLLATTGCTNDYEGLTVEQPPEEPTYKDMVLATEGLIGYWRLGEPSGALTAVNSFNGGTLDGDYVNPAGIALQEPGVLPNDTAALFAGGLVDVPSMPPLAGEVTVELWMMLPAPVPDWGLLVGCYEPIVSEPDTTIATGYRLRVRTVSDQFEIEAIIGGMTDADALTATAPIAISDAEPPWHHVVLTYALGQQKAELYIDGGQLSPPAAGIFNVVTTQSPSLRFGGGYEFFNQVTYPYLGLLDEVALYQNWLPGDEVEKHFKTATNTTPP